MQNLSNKMQPDVSLVIPFLNERENVPVLIRKLDDFFKQHIQVAFEVVFVDDGSSDGSSDEIKKYISKDFAPSKIIKLSRNFGSHAAIRAGFGQCNGKYCTLLSADLQDPLELLVMLFEKASIGFDIVFAFRNEAATGFISRSFTKLYALLMRQLVNPDYPDNGFDIVFFSQKVKDILNNNVEANSSLQLQLLSLGFSQAKISYVRQPRTIGKSKWTLGQKIKLLVDSFVAFSYAPIRFVTYTGFLFFVVGVLWTVYIVVRKYVSNDLIIGWPMLTSLLLLGFGITNISLGIIAEYLWRTLDASRKRPVFIVDSVVEFNKS